MSLRAVVVTVSARFFFSILQVSPESPHAKVPPPSTRNNVSLLGVSALVPLLCTRTSATPITYLPELVDGERGCSPEGSRVRRNLPYGREPNSSSLVPLVYARHPPTHTVSHPPRSSSSSSLSAEFWPALKLEGSGDAHASQRNNRPGPTMQRCSPPLRQTTLERSGSGTDELARAGLTLSCQQQGGNCAEGDVLHAELTTTCRAAPTSAPSRRAAAPLTFVGGLCLSLLRQLCPIVYCRLHFAEPYSKEKPYHARPDRLPDFQRSPTVAPSIDNSCPNLPSQCHIVCLLYNGTFTAADLIKTGEWRSQFQVVIAGE